MAKQSYTRNTLDISRLPDTLTMAQGALILGVSEATVRRYVEQEGLPAILISTGPRKLFKLDKQALLAWREGRTVNKPAASAGAAASAPVQIDLAPEAKRLLERMVCALETLGAAQGKENPPPDSIRAGA